MAGSVTVRASRDGLTTTTAREGPSVRLYAMAPSMPSASVRPETRARFAARSTAQRVTSGRRLGPVQSIVSSSKRFIRCGAAASWPL